MEKVYICDALRTPIGRYGGSLSAVRPDDLAAHVIKKIAERNPAQAILNIDDVIFGCANQAGEDNRNIARMALLLAGLPESIPGVTVNRLCASGMEAVALGARAIMAGEAEIILAGGVESMSRAPMVIGKATEAFSRTQQIYDTTIGWRFINPVFDKQFGTDSMIETAENIASEHNISRRDQDLFAFRSQEKAQKAQASGYFEEEIAAVPLTDKRGNTTLFSADEHPRLVGIEKLSELKSVGGKNGTVTAGNASGINDGAAALLLASSQAVQKYGLKPVACISGAASAGVPPRLMGMGPVPATLKLTERLGISLKQIDIIELNEAFAAQSLGCIRALGLADDDSRINPLGGAIALGHPLGMSGARIVVTAVLQLKREKLRYALCTMCVGVGQGSAMLLEGIQD
jgi:acetyl-CoA acyltransferase